MSKWLNKFLPKTQHSTTDSDDTLYTMSTLSVVDKGETSTLSTLSVSNSCVYEYNNLEERIAIVQEKEDLPEAWAEAFARLDCMNRPTSISYKTWQNIINNTGLLLDNHIQDIIAHGWSVADIFGVHKNAPEKRFDAMGLLVLLGTSNVTRVEQGRIVIVAASSKEQGFYRERISNPLERIMIWELT